MEITYLGHAGFYVETKETLVVADPWLSPDGAFDGAWFQFPNNHHLAAWLDDKFSRSEKQRFVYISHEHKDHFDPKFLDSLSCRAFTLVMPKFRRSALRKSLEEYSCLRVCALSDNESLSFPGGELTLYVDDSELNRDSAVMIRADGTSFLNLNDCKLYDQLARIRQAHGNIDAFACQFSGATWHPTCYDYPREEYRRISRRKRLAKFETVARAIEALQPSFYLPSAGPACFLDPQLLHLNFETDSIFPQTPEFLAFLARRVRGGHTQWMNWMPGDSVDLDGRRFVSRAKVRVDRDNYETYIKEYARGYAEFFAALHRVFARDELERLRERLRDCFREKLDHLSLYERVPIPLYFGFSDSLLPMVRVDFAHKLVTLADAIAETDFYSIVAPAWQVVRVLDGKLTWEDFALTFRMRLKRCPDLYQPLIQAFLIMEAEDLKWFCDKVVSLEQVRSRIAVQANGGQYQIDRFCPHQGGDLTTGWAEGSLWTCPRHRWHYDLEKGGECTSSKCSIHATKI